MQVIQDNDRVAAGSFQTLVTCITAFTKVFMTKIYYMLSIARTCLERFYSTS